MTAAPVVRWTFVAAPILLLGALLGASPGRAAPALVTSPDIPTVRAVEGAIRGRVVVSERPARRRARSYGGAVTIPEAPQNLPTVVWIRGRVPGHPAPAGPAPMMAQQDTAFVPAFVTVAVGGEVIFPNRDGFYHNVFSYTTGSRFDLGAYARGEQKEVRFEVPGMVSVFCEVHDRMRAGILVLENPFWAVVAEDGSFAFDGVPAGDWTVVAWDPDRGEREVRVTVRDGAATDVTIEVG